MSAPAATTRYIIAADDKTKAAIASINAGFKSIDRGVKSTVRGINTSLGLIAGMGLKRAFQSIFTETANSSREFATALDDVKRAARDLLSADDGAPAATAALKELAETLKDPATQKAADDLTSTLIRGFAAVTSGAAHAVVGWEVILGLTGDEVENLRRQIAAIDGQLANKRASLNAATGMFAQGLRTDIAALEAERNLLIRQQNAAIDRGPANQGKEISLPSGATLDIPGFNVPDLNIADDLTKQMAEFQRLDNMIPVDHLQEQLGEFVKTFDSQINEGVVESAQRASDSIAEIGDKLGEDILGKSKELSVFAEQAARDMQSAFADFLFDPFEGGLKGMLKGFVDVIRRMIAEAAAAQIFETLFGSGSKGKSGAGNAFVSFLGSVFSSSTGSVPKYASGTDYVPRDQLALVHKGERIIPASMNRAGAGSAPVINVTNNIDARGATSDVIKALPEVMRRNNEAVKADIIRGLRSGKY